MKANKLLAIFAISALLVGISATNFVYADDSSDNDKEHKEKIDQVKQHKKELREEYKIKLEEKKKIFVDYKKELKDSYESSMRRVTRGGISSKLTTSKAVASKAKPSTTGILKGAPSKLTAPKIAIPPVLPQGATNLVNINKASVSDLVLTLGLSRELAVEVVSNRPYRLRGELVAKNVIPKATFDEIKGRITASP